MNLHNWQEWRTEIGTRQREIANALRRPTPENDEFMVLLATQDTILRALYSLLEKSEKEGGDAPAHMHE